jgi:1,4-dihydroxy-2-naphthoate octaprenyltransferase
LSTIKIKIWFSAFRLRTLPLSIASIGMGGFLAASIDSFQPSIFIFCVITTVLLQILSNLANDYGDYKNGVDGLTRKGPARAVQSGKISPKGMVRAIKFFAFLSLMSGVYLLYLGLDISFNFLGFFLLGLLAILAAIKYTAGAKPYGYSGWGDISVFIFFGLVGVLGTCFLQADYLPLSFLLPAGSCGFFSAAVLNINNIRDIDSDKLAGKRSIPVRLGAYAARIYHWLLLIAGCLCTVFFMLLSYNFNSAFDFLFLLSFPFIIYNGLIVWKTKDPLLLDSCLRLMALSTLFYVFSFGVGILLGH